MFYICILNREKLAVEILVPKQVTKFLGSTVVGYFRDKTKINRFGLYEKIGQHFHHSLDGLVSPLGRGLELGSNFSASIVALELHFQSVFDVFLHHLCSLFQFMILLLCLCS